MMRRSLYSLAFKRVIKVVSKRPAGQVSSGVAAAAATAVSPSQGSVGPNVVDRNVNVSVPSSTPSSLASPHSSSSPLSSIQQPIAPPQPDASTSLAGTPPSIQQPISQTSQGTTTSSTTSEVTDTHITHVPRKKIIKKIIKKKKIIHGSSSSSAMPSSKVNEASANVLNSQQSQEKQQQHEQQNFEESQEELEEEVHHAEVHKSELAESNNIKNASMPSKAVQQLSHNTQYEEPELEHQQEQEEYESNDSATDTNNKNKDDKYSYQKSKTEAASAPSEEEEVVNSETKNVTSNNNTNSSTKYNMRYTTPEDMPAEPTIIPVRNAHSSNAHSGGDANSEIKKAAKKSRIRVSTGQDLYDELRAPSGSYNRSYNNSNFISHKTDASGNKSTTRTDSHDKSGSSSRSNVAMKNANTNSGGGGGKKTPMVKGFRVDEVLSICGPGDAVFARRLPSGGCQFFAWPGTPLSIASSAIVSMPDTIRTVHAVFGRTKVPIDIVMDVDCPVPQEEWSMSRIRPYQQKVLDDTLNVVKEELDKIGVEIETQVVLQSPNLKKASFHIHTKLKDVAFEDYESLHGFLARFRSRIPYVDLQIYRTHGMLRMFSCMKENRTSAMVVFDDPKWNIGFANGQVPDEAAALHSVCVREPGTFSRLLKFDPPRMAPYGMHVNSDENGGSTAGNNYNNNNTGNGEQDGFKPIPVLLPRTEKEAIENASMWLRSATEAEVTEWRSWIALGLCAYRVAHHFKDASTLPRPAMEVMLEAWVEASRKCPQKFKHGDCEARWASFDITKMKYDSNWWSAYQHLGRLSVPAQHAIAEENKREAERLARYKQYKPDN